MLRRKRMKVTISDCLELEAFEGATVLAGKSGLSNEVRTISSLDLTDREDMVVFEGDEHEILLTGFFNAKDDPKLQIDFVNHIAERGCAALAVFYVGRALPKIDISVIAAAERAGLPLIQMSKKATFSETISEVMDSVLYGDNFRNRLISNTVFHLLNFEKHQNFQAAAREAAINNGFQLIILSQDYNPVFTVETRHKASLADAIRKGREQRLEGEKIYAMIDVEGVPTYWGVTRIGSEKFYMMIVDNEDSYTAGEITKLAEIIELAMGMWKYTPERDAKSEFIKALVRGNKSMGYTLQAEAKLEEAEIVSAFFTKGLAREEEGRAIATFEENTNLEVLRIYENDESYGMILTTDSSSFKTPPHSRCDELFDSMKETKNARIFHVTGLNGIEGAGDAFKLITETWNFVQNVFPYKRVFTKYELALVSNCINIHLQGGFVKKNYTDLLAPFEAAGATKGKQLLDTLETFVLDAGMNSGKTADIMNVHANTVQYRLKKINEMLGVEVTGNRVIPGLTLALALNRLEYALP